MRLRGLVFERFGVFERAEVDLCDENGAPLDVVLFVGAAGTGKSALLRGISGLLVEAVGGREELIEEDIRRGEDTARCRVVFDDLVESTSRIVVTLEKEITTRAASSKTGTDKDTRGLRASPPDAFERWRKAIEREAAPRAAFSIASSPTGDDDDDDDDDDDSPPIVDESTRSVASTRLAPAAIKAPVEEEEPDGDPLFQWLFGLRGGPSWQVAVRALDRVLWPCRLDHMPAEGDMVFETPTGLASASELGDAFESVLVMALELLRLSTDRPNEELVYVIDDIDAHLHPRWQSRIIGDLQRAFPRVQLVASTHSPFVVASVEPHQVFRLEHGVSPHEGSHAVIRVSDRVQKGGVVSSIMDLAFGAPDLPGPRWVHTPPAAIRRDVLRAIDETLTRGAVVYVLPELVHVRDIRNAFSETVFAGVESANGHVFFIDLEPGNPWGHSCEYVFRSRDDGKLTRATGIWPPSGLERFVPIGRG